MLDSKKITITSIFTKLNTNLRINQIKMMHVNDNNKDETQFIIIIIKKIDVK